MFKSVEGSFVSAKENFGEGESLINRSRLHTLPRDLLGGIFYAANVSRVVVESSGLLEDPLGDLIAENRVPELRRQAAKFDHPVAFLVSEISKPLIIAAMVGVRRWISDFNNHREEYILRNGRIHQ